jgi:hypothetical protein
LTKIELNILSLRALSRYDISELHLDQLDLIHKLNPLPLCPRPDLPEQLALEPVDRLVAFGVINRQPEVYGLTRLERVPVHCARDLCTAVLNEAQARCLVVLAH